MSHAEPTRWADVARYVVERMPEVGIANQAELVRRSGVSDPTVRELMKGERRAATILEPTERAMCRALRWEDGSITRILNGLEPIPNGPPVVLTLDQLAGMIDKRLIAILGKIDEQQAQISALTGLATEVASQLQIALGVLRAPQPSAPQPDQAQTQRP